MPPLWALYRFHISSFATRLGQAECRGLKRHIQRFASIRLSQYASSLSTDRLVYFKQVILQEWSIGGND
ncbi:hypothetical protein FVEG_16445 [Fusarium verticillioides 7600]|uniref:Uncharacterized protein n=1 Tax=Gibberella moniliformis (strain M3125 / FGSC 7600) TaxID=334819 RepID=W7MCL3_GIBM7|nr:hypothetical protein FVEG_16445 [Fusarium verticillioides 7600]EWG49233.1 hypothetical protein FVEG_16445 [Fusarium verticillioides 7600]